MADADLIEDEGNASDDAESSRIKVFLRMRPMNKLELSRRSKHCVQISSFNNRVNGRVHIDSPLEGEYAFNFDRVFDECDLDKNIYEEVASPLVSKLVQGFNATLVAYGQSGSGKSTSLNGMKGLGSGQNQNMKEQRSPQSPIDDKNDDVGMIARVANDIFSLMHESLQETEFTVRVSFMEIYLESIRDLLSPTNRFLKISESDSGDEYAFDTSMHVVVEGLTEICCVRASDVISLLKRGLAFQTVNERRKEMKNCKSNTIFRIKIEQKNIITERKKKSTFLIVNAGSSEISRGGESMRSLESHALQLEKKLLDCSQTVLDEVVTTLEKGNLCRSETEQLAVFRKSKLTTMLIDSLGGNCFTSFLLTASPASFNINATLATARFGKRLSRVTNHPKVNVEPSPRDFQEELDRAKKSQSELVMLLKDARAEIEEMKSEDFKTFLASKSWRRLNEICDRNAFIGSDDTHNQEDLSVGASSTDEELRLANEKIEALQNTLSEVILSRDETQTSLDKLQEECVLLRHENQRAVQAKLKNAADLIEVRSQIQSLNQRNTEMEHNLRTSRFRENESVVFLRHYRRFYRRLLENIHAQGSGDISSILTMHMSSAPDLDELIDLDKMLMDSGLLEEREVGEDSESGPYIPSKEALVRSSTQATNMTSQTLSQLNAMRSAVNRSINETKSSQSVSESTMSTLDNSESYAASKERDLKEILDSIIPVSNRNPALANKEDSVASQAQSVPTRNIDVERQQLLQKSPAGQLTQKRIDELEGEVILMSKRCIELQTSLNDAEDKLESLTLAKRVKKKLQHSQENRDLKKELDKKGADLEAVIWKMNELHLINKTYDDKLSNREQHIAYLEDTLFSLQEKNLRLGSIHVENEKRLRGELDRMNTIIDSLSSKMWQHDSNRDLMESRIIIPFQSVIGSGLVSETGDNPLGPNSGVTNSASVRVGLGMEAAKKWMSMANALVDSDEEDTVLGTGAILTTRTIDGEDVHGDEKLKISMEDMYSGGKEDESYVPIRFAPKRGRLIKAATLTGREMREQQPVGDENIDVKLIQRQLKKLDVLSKSWKDRQRGTQ